MPRTFASALAVIALLAAGCAAQDDQPPADGIEAGSGEPETIVAAADSDMGTMVVQYEDATTPEAQRGRDLMQKTRVLEQLADDVTATYKLPYDIPLVGAQCDEANDYWSPDDQTMTMCYEDVNESLEIFGEAGDPDPEGAARRVVIASFFHELGHMAIDIYQLPATGREEDVADQLAASILLGPDDDGNIDPDYVQAAKDQAREYRIYAQQGAPDESSFADVHTLDGARAYNFECWIYGSDPDANTDIVAQGLLPQARADGCQDEFDKLTNAWAELLDPHVK
ncbi:DUF4344 domain-containing metallopeptidase [Mycolicibacterium goodii]|uniref:DUF4344 domain-containing metallopeptidase n=1 Tax=Mycolicibacterium goodii TaxID=134601 RepID=UPI001F039C5D|nr:DUF4344 domain-containing metallopeptidase [Mycolicibacterium goodii]ULN48219.1 DUF4344 domain-containing metallopeptidase [Mycolicibacterium goodii]